MVINGGDCAIMLTWHKWFHLSESAFLTTLSRIIVSLSIKQTTAAAARKLGHVGTEQKAVWTPVVPFATFCYFEMYIT